MAKLLSFCFAFYLSLYAAATWWRIFKEVEYIRYLGGDSKETWILQVAEVQRSYKQFLRSPMSPL